MSELVARLMHANLHDVFGERDDDRRKAAISRVYTDDVVFTDPEGSVSGHAALDEKVRTLQERFAGFVFAEDSPLYNSPDSGCLAWRFGPDGQPPVVRGIDIASISDGRISSLNTLLAE